MLRLRRCLRKLALAVCGAVVLLAVGEGYLRYGEHLPSPLEYMHNYIGTGHHLLHSELGWVNAPGIIACQEHGVGYEMTWPNGQRASRVIAKVKRPTFRVAVLGCSYIYGFGVQDRETYVWRLNEAYRDIVFDNYGVEDYGTHQCYQKMRQLVNSAPPYDLFIYSPIYDHLFRNAHDNFISLDNDKLVLYPGVTLHNYDKRRMDYSCWPGEDRLALVHFGRKLVYSALSNIAVHDRDHISPAKFLRCCEIYADLLQEMDNYANQQGSKFLICALDAGGYRLTKDCPGSQNWQIVNCALPRDPQFYNNGEVWNHPGSKGHELYFQAISLKVRELLSRAN